ncbi:MAG: hypothetical protein PHT77_13155, partial [Bacteroidales bacterium]|nr:hypothetical protein [Bacteroidales bacterium]
VNGTSTNVSLIDGRPVNGSVRWLSDELYISSYPSVHIMVNNTTANILNLTTATPYLDITTYDLGNITVWANQTISVSRQSVFRQVQRIIYSTVPSTGYYYTSAIISNPSTRQWKPTYWYIGYAVNPVTGASLAPDTGTIELYDVNNAVTLQAGRHYEIGITSVSMMLEYLNSSISRTMTLRYYLNNGTAPLSMPILSIRSYEISSYKDNTMYKGSAMYTNEATASYSGGIQLSLKGLTGDIKANSLVLYDVTHDREIPDEFWSYSGTTIDISSEIVGTIGMGDSIEYAIYFKYETDTGEPFFLFDGAYSIGWLNINWHLAIFIVGLFLALLGIGDFLVGGGKGKENKKLEARGVVLILAACFVMVIYFMLWIWHSVGAL